MCVCSTHKHDNKQRGQSIERQNKIIAWLHQPSVYENAFKAFCKSIKLHLMLTAVFRCCWLCSRFIQELDNLFHNVNSYFLVFLHIFSLSIVRLSVFTADSRWIKGFHFGGEGEREWEWVKKREHYGNWIESEWQKRSYRSTVSMTKLVLSLIPPFISHSTSHCTQAPIHYYDCSTLFMSRTEVSININKMLFLFN